MIKFFVPRPLIGLIIGINMLFISCGKKAENTKQSVTRDTQPVVTDLENFLNKQEVNCERGQVCPNYISKIVVFQGQKVNYCTGFLVERDVVATSSSCLGNSLRVEGIDCSKDVHLFFPKTYNGVAERAGCAQVLQASQLEADDPVLWRDDVAFLKLDKQMSRRRNLEIFRNGMPEDIDKNGYSIWKIEKVDEFTALIKLDDKCEVVFNSFVNPLSSSDSSPNVLLAGCAIKEESSGAPILARGRVRGIVSKPLDEKFKQSIVARGLLQKPLKDMIHVSNFACAPTIYDADVRDEKECTKNLSITALDRLRSDMLNPEILFEKVRKNLENSLNDLSKYIKFNVLLTPKDDKQVAEITPSCFKNLSVWIDSLGSVRGNYTEDTSIPSKSYKRAMDSYGRIYADETDLGSEEYYLQFSPKFLKINKRSNVYMWNETVNRLFKDMVECPSLL
ncbi:MAG: hypothetical protein AB7I27_09690 [Bacteriovoracaceae bacterium]